MNNQALRERARADDLAPDPAAFYRSLGFRETGEVDEGEVRMRLEL